MTWKLRALPALAAALAVVALPVAPAAADDGTRDHVVVSGGVTIPLGEVAGDVFVLDGPVRIAGRVTGDVVSVAGPVGVTGRIDGTLTTVSDRATLGPTASVGDDVLYGDERPVIHSAADIGGEVSDEGWADLARPEAISVLSVTWWIAISISTLLIGTGLLWAAPRLAERTWQTARARTGVAVAWGAGLFVGVPIAAFAAMFTLVGIPLAVATLLALVPLGAIGYATGGWLLGRLVLKRPREPIIAFLAGWAILRAVAIIPGLGLAAAVAATVAGIGAIAVTLYALRGEEPSPTAPSGTIVPPLPAS